MIQIYSPDNTDFDKNGNMVLWPSEATVHVILNSTWEASLFQPLDEDGRWKYIENNAVVKLPSFNGEQLFRIYDTDKDESGVTAKMYPIFYDAANEVFFTSVHPTDKDGQGALDVLCEGTRYSGSSDIDTVETAYYEYVNLIEALNGSIDQAFTSRWGGEILFDNYEVTINSEAGEDRGYSLSYGRNIPANGLSIETDMSDVVTRIYPQAYNGRALSGDGYVDSDLIGNYPTIRAKTITYDYIRLADDVSEDEEDSEDILICEDEDELDAALIAACEDEFADGLDKPSVTITADIVALEGTEQYQEFSGLAELSLGDTVTVYHTLLGIDTSVRVTELTYDCISETVTDITLGDFKSDYFDQTATKVANLTSAVETAREAAAAALAAANDATLLSVILSSEYQGVPVDDDGEYEELPDISTTVQVFYSNEDVTSKCDLDQSPSGLTGEWEDATYTVTEVTEDNAYVNLLISYGTLSVTKKFTVSKVYSGTEGPAGEDGKTSYFHIKYSEVESPTLSSEMTEEPSTYIGTYVDFEEADSNDPSDYTWSRFEGAQGEQGEQGIAGTNGEDGQTSYLHIAYANSEDGMEDFSVSDSEDKSYIGQYVDFEEDDSTDPEDYNWTLIKGEDGDSITILSTTVRYQISDSGTDVPVTGSWSEEVPATSQGDFLWTRTIVNYSDGGTTISYSVAYIGVDGTDGKTAYFHIKYSDYESPTSTSQMTETPSTYIGTYVDYTEDDSNDPADYTWSRFQGLQGDQGVAGTNGEDGKTYYLHIAYANSEDGETDFSVTDSTDKSYIGVYTDTESADSTDPADYSWTLIKGEDGSSVYVVSAQVLYQVSDSATETPTGTWLSEIPEVESGKFLWTKTEVVYSDGEYTEAYSVTYFPADGADGSDGSDGVGVESITEYYLRSSSSSGITTSTSGWSTTIPTITSTYKYLWNYEVIAYTDGNSTSTDPAVIGVYGDTGATGATGAAGADGADGVGISSIIEYYARSTSNSTAPTSWSESVPTLTSTYKYLWNYEVITYTDASSDETDKRVIGVYGDTGATGASGADGSDGVGISSITEYYARSTSNSTTPSSWSTSVPTLTSTYKYLWNYETITYTDDSTTSTTAHVVGVYGDTGDTGAAGSDGADGTSFSWNLFEGTSNSEWKEVSVAQYYGTAYSVDFADLDVEEGDYLTISGYIKGGSEKTICPRIQFYTSSSTRTSITLSASTYQTTQDGSVYFSYSWALTEAQLEYTAVQFLIQNVTNSTITTTTTEYCKSIKLEYGDTASEWTPSYNDIYGVGIESITEYYAASTSNSTSPSSWSTTPPTMTSTNKYLWNYETVTYTDSTTTSTDPAVIGVYGDTGDDGESISISSKSVTYQSSSSGTTTPTGTWSSSVPSVSQGKFLWTKTVVTYSDGTSTTSYSVSYIAVDGTDGTSVTISGTEITYQLSSSGTTVPTGTWSESVPSLSQGKYLWTKTEVTYTDGTVTTSYSVSYLAIDGDDGEDGATLYATCSTAAGTTTKVATITPTNSDFALSTGVTINVTFTYKNTASSPKLNVNSTGAKSIYAFGSSLAEVYYWSAGSTVQFVYNGSQWVMTDNAAMTIAANWCYENDTTYIDGANIYAGTLAANSIIAGDTLTNALTATNLTVTGDSTFEGTITGSTITGSDIYTSGTSTSGTVVADDRWAHLYNGTIEFGHFEDDDSEATDGYITGADGGSIGMVGESELVLECPVLAIRTTSDLSDGCGFYITDDGISGYGVLTSVDNFIVKKSSGACVFRASRTDTGQGISLQVGSGGYNRGLYDETQSKFLICMTSANEVYLNGSTRLIGSGTIYTAGFISSSTLKVYFSIPYIAYGASPTLTISSVALRQEGSYLGGGSSTSNNVTQSFSTSYTYYKAGYFQVTLTFSSTITNGINNDVVAVSCSYTVA